jgi:hypothetical protein
VQTTLKVNKVPFKKIPESWQVLGMPNLDRVSVLVGAFWECTEGLCALESEGAFGLDRVIRTRQSFRTSYCFRAR